MKSESFFKSRAFLVSVSAIGGIAIGYFLLAMLVKTDAGPDPLPTDTNCITITRDEMVDEGQFDAGWHDPNSDNYTPSIVFVPEEGDPLSVSAYLVDKECNKVERTKMVMRIGDASDELRERIRGLGLQECRYDFDFTSAKPDIDAFNDLLYFHFMRLIPRPDPTDPTKLGFDVQFVRSSGGTETPLARLVTRPCPPYCPR